MKLTNGRHVPPETELWEACDPVITKPGIYRRSCHFPVLDRLWIGYGDFETSRKALNALWKRESWKLYVDRRAVDLKAFGTAERILIAYPPAGGKDAILREWAVRLVDPPRGKHTIRYITRSTRTSAVVDATWTVSIG